MRSFLLSALLVALVLLTSSAVALPRDAALKARSPAPSSPARRAPAPSPPTKRFEARAPAPSNARRSIREQEPILADISQQLCPMPMHVCPLTSEFATAPSSLEAWTTHGFECVDFSADLGSCGGCSTLDTKYDCTAIPGALGVSCIAGGCRIDSCLPGHTLAPDGMTCVLLQ